MATSLACKMSKSPNYFDSMNSPELARFQRMLRHQDTEPCRSCGTPYAGNFCPQCGQEAATGAPTALGMVYEFLTRNVFERGKLWRTLWRLVRHPGALTVDFLEGRRQHLIRPVRLYFSLSVLVFLLLSIQSETFIGEFMLGWAAADYGPDQVQRQAGPVTPAPFFDWIEKKFPASHVQQRAHKLAVMPPNELIVEEARAALNNLPKSMFLLMPAFAWILRALFARRAIPYGAHLLFAVHYHCLVFLGALVSIVMPDFVSGLMFAGQWLWLLLALRTTYCISWWRTFYCWALLSVLYSLLLSVTGVGLALVGVLF